MRETSTFGPKTASFGIYIRIGWVPIDSRRFGMAERARE
jgi:hypothetical protein